MIVLGEKIVAMGGNGIKDGITSSQRNVEEFDVATQTWSDGMHKQLQSQDPRINALIAICKLVDFL